MFIWHLALGGNGLQRNGNIHLKTKFHGVFGLFWNNSAADLIERLLGSTNKQMAKPRILFLSESLNIGGAEKALVSILKIIDYSKFDVSLLLVSETGAFLEDVCHVKGLKRRYIVKQSANPIVFLINVLKIKAFYKWLPTRTVGNYLCQDHDVVIAFCEGYLTKWVAAATIPCIKIAWVHTDMVENDWPVKSGVFKTVEEEQKAYQRFDDIVAVSKTVASGVSEKFKINRVHTIYNILDTDRKSVV